MAGFTGEKKDKLGRTTCWNNGKRIACPKKDKPAKAPKASQVRLDIKQTLARGATSADVERIAANMARLSQQDINSLKKELALKAGGKKEAQARSIAEQALSGKKPKEKPKAAASQADDVRSDIRDTLARGATSADVDRIAANMARLGQADINALKKELAIKVGGKKEAQAKTIAEQALKAAATTKDATSKAEPPKTSQPRSPKPGFTGTDTLGRRWVNGKLTGEVEEAKTSIGRKIQAAKAIHDVVAKLSQMETHDDLYEERTKQQKKRGKLLNRADVLRGSKKKSDKEEFVKVQKELSDLTVQEAKFHERLKSVKANQRKELKKLLTVQSASPVKGKTSADVPEQLKNEWNEAEQFLDGLVQVGSAGEQLPQYDILVAPDNRANYGRGRKHQIELSTYTGGTVVAVHEAGHGIEAKMPGAQQAANDFLDHRLKGEKPQQLNKVMKGTVYKDSEYGAKDEFANAFEEHEAWYIGKRYASGDTEIVSMGIQQLYDNPAKFAARDPEYCAFVIGVLNGELRNNPDEIDLGDVGDLGDFGL